MSFTSGSDTGSTRSRLIRELARSTAQSRTSTSSRRSQYVDLTSTSFNPSEEAECSTRRLDVDIKKLRSPDLRESAKKYKYPLRPMPEPEISTSQLGLAFPDFTQGMMSSDGSISIEKGRGVSPKNHMSSREFSPSGFDDSFALRDAPANSSFNAIKPLRDTTPLPTYGLATPKPSYPTETRFSAEFGDMPNLSELVSGVFENGTPLFSKLVPPAKPLAKFEHASIKNIPSPPEEQAIYLSLNLLKEKLARLEASKAEDAAMIENLRTKNEELTKEKSEHLRSRRSDSAYGSSSGSDGAEEYNIGFRRTTIEKLRLEANLKDTREQLKNATQSYNASVEHVKKVAEERDTLTHQLGVAYVTIRSLQADLQSLNSENEQLRNLLQHRPQTPVVEPQTRPHRTAAEIREAKDLTSFSAKSDTNYSETKLSTKNISRRASDPVQLKRNQSEDGDLTCLSDKSGDLFPEIRLMLEKARSTNRMAQVEHIMADGPPKPIPVTKDYTVRSNVSSEFQPRSEISLLEQKRRRQGLDMGDLTSAYIMPDVTLSNAGFGSAEPELPASKPFERLIDHDLGKCTICRRLLEPGKPHNHKKSTKTIPKPVPVSECVPSPTPSNEDPTMRPAQAPGLALARVINDLEDECKHLKMGLKKLENLSHQHVPALSRTKRIRLEAKIAKARSEMSSKSDQIYALYDVLEGQKDAGQEMSQLEVEITLQDIGIDTSILDFGSDYSKLNLRGGGFADQTTSDHGNTATSLKGPESQKPLRPALKRPTSQHAWDNLSENNSLPWEGFESNVDDHTSSTRRSSKLRGRF